VIRIVIGITLLGAGFCPVHVKHPVLRCPGTETVNITVEHTERCGEYTVALRDLGDSRDIWDNRNIPYITMYLYLYTFQVSKHLRMLKQ
jgi:hypothetical protein